MGYKRTVHPRSEREEVDADQYQVAPCEWQPGTKGDDTIVATPQPNGVLVGDNSDGGSSGRDDRIFGLEGPDSLDGGPGKGNAANCETLVAIP